MRKGHIIVIFILSAMAFLLVFGRVLFAFFFLPLEKFHCITIPEDEYVSYEELYKQPENIAEEDWFPFCLLRWQLRQLERYMKTNNVYIAPGEYAFYNTYYGEELIEIFNYVDANTLEPIASE